MLALAIPILVVIALSHNDAPRDRRTVQTNAATFAEGNSASIVDGFGVTSRARRTRPPDFSARLPTRTTRHLWSLSQKNARSSGYSPVRFFAPRTTLSVQNARLYTRCSSRCGRDDFLSAVAHELKTPLTVISASSWFRQADPSLLKLSAVDLLALAMRLPIAPAAATVAAG